MNGAYLSYIGDPSGVESTGPRPLSTGIRGLPVGVILNRILTREVSEITYLWSIDFRIYNRRPR